MRCDDAQLGVSLRADGEPPGVPPDDLDAHVASCGSCRAFAGVVQDLRADLRVEAVDHTPDLGPSVLALVAAQPDHLPPVPARPRRIAAVAVAAVAGLVAGATFVGVGREPGPPAAADVPDLVVAAQTEVASLEARYTVSEPGTGADGASRTYDAHLVYRAPESLALQVQETTAGAPAPERAAGALIVDDDRWWHEVIRRCSPAAGLVTCPAAPTRWSQEVTGRAPSSTAAPVPLDLVVPVDSFTLAADPAGLGVRTIAGHRAVGVSVTAAQVARLLDGLSAAVELRPVHPADPVELWLDAERLVPLAVVARATDDPARAAWAASHGRPDDPGAVVLRVEATDVRIDEPEVSLPAIPTTPTSASLDAGFRAAPPGEDPEVPVPVPVAVPAGFRPDRAGVVAAGGPRTGVRSWTDGRGWFTVQATADWDGDRLFGDLGADVRPIELDGAGTAYVSADGQRIGLHADDLDVVVAGSLPPERLAAIAAGLGVTGGPVPSGWVEAATASPTEADAALPGRLRLDESDGYGPPALRVTAEDGSGPTVTETRAGPGDRRVVLAQRPGTALPPPSNGGEIGVAVRGTVGRYSVADGELAWVEAGQVCTLRSSSLTAGELVAIAERAVRR
jgi:hypothetical protein